jgi:threonine/homoserine/homoserine lactone efflux protein
VNELFGALVGIAVFGFVTSVTPGPNNMYLLTSGVNFGVRKSLAYVNGIMLGLTVMFSAMFLGVGTLFRAFPVIQEVLKYAGFAYILYMAFSIVSSSFVHKHERVERAGFFRATAFQLINPKAWIVLISMYATFIGDSTDLTRVGLNLLVFLIATYPGAVIWAAFGQLLAGWLSNPKSRRIFNISAAVLLVASMIPVLFL